MVDKLIASEMKRMPKPRDASSLGFPDIDLFSSNTLIQQELDRVRRGKPMDPALDLSRYQLDPPTSTTTTSNTAAANGSTETITPSASEELPEGHAQWLKALDNANAQLEHQNQRVLNLELVQKFGGNAWNIHNYQMEYDVSLLRKAVDEKKAEIMELNKLRKRDQVKPQGRGREGFVHEFRSVCELVCISRPILMHFFRLYSWLRSIDGCGGVVAEAGGKVGRDDQLDTAGRGRKRVAPGRVGPVEGI